jgi:hypothetical protein
MRCVLLIVGVAVLAGCPPQTIEKLPPPGQFYFPTGVVHVDAPGNPEGILYVANANTDKRFNFGTVVAVDLSKVGLPPFGAAFGMNDAGFGAPLELTDLKLVPSSSVLIAPFAGEMAALPRPDAGGVRLYLPTKSEEHRLYGIDAPTPSSPATPPLLACFSPPGAPASTFSEDGGLVDCTPTGLSLVSFEKSESGIPRAPSPIGVAISAKREVWVTALQQADTPRLSTFDPRGYVVHVDGDSPVISDDVVTEDGGVILGSFVNVGQGATNSIVVGSRYAFATGRIYASAVPANLVRAIDTTTLATYNTFLENTFTVFEGRGTALSSKEDRLYILGRSPDTLLVASVTNPGSDLPNVRVERSVPLPEAPNLITTIPRAGKSDLVMITCSSAGVVVFYDDEVGNLTAQIEGVGLQPYAMAVDTRPTGGARVYVTNFSDGRVAVIDVPELSRPASAKIVAFLGTSQLCITRGVNEQTSCDGGEM